MSECSHVCGHVNAVLLYVLVLYAYLHIYLFLCLMFDFGRLLVAFYANFFCLKKGYLKSPAGKGCRVYFAVKSWRWCRFYSRLGV